MSFLAAAVGGAGILGAGASIYGANKASEASQNAAAQAAQVQREGQTNALNFQKDVYGAQTGNYNDAKTNLNPYIQTGAGANNLLQQFYGIGPNGQLGPSTMDSFLKSPDYNFALSQGTAALDNSAASKGGLLGGNQIRAQTEYGQGLATTQLQNYLGRLTGMSQQGMQAGGALGVMGSTIGNGSLNPNASTNITGSNNIAQSLMGGGTAAAAGITGMVGGFNQGLQNLTNSAPNLLNAYKQMSSSSYTPSGGYATGGSGLSLSGTGGLY